MASSFLRVLDHTQLRTTVGRTPLDEWSARRRDLYLTKHNTHNKQISMPPGGIRTHDLSRRAAADLRLRPRGHWDRLAGLPKLDKTQRMINSQSEFFNVISCIFQTFSLLINLLYYVLWAYCIKFFILYYWKHAGDLRPHVGQPWDKESSRCVWVTPHIHYIVDLCTVGDLNPDSPVV